MSTKHSRNRHGRAQAVAPVSLPVVTPGCRAAFLAFTQRPRVVEAPAEAVSIAIDCTETAGGKACTKCGVVKPLTEFYLAAGRSTYREACCKACKVEAWAATAGTRRRTITGKACKTCGVVKPVSAFNPSARTEDRLTVKCIACINSERARRAELERATATESLGALDVSTVAVTVTASAQLINAARLGYEARQAKTGRVVYEHGRVKIEARHDRKSGATEFFVGGWPCPVDYLTNVFDEIHSGRPVSWL
ncbi:hypothetical protein [Caballeronia sp. LjRoot31]|uniref:hypothetical protein n=1 Tax=Caballeronia sp. LjRoot31 TaxID=3342324 RepID=UPI003ECF505C